MDKYNVFGLGNALVDYVVQIDEDFLKKNDVRKGVMTLVENDYQKKLLEALKDLNPELHSGGSAANTMIGIARCGGTAFYTGKVASDPNGAFYKSDLKEAGVDFSVPPGSGQTGTCLVMTTKDGDRTMLTNLGISSEISNSDIDSDRIKESSILYVEGYLWDKQNSKDASVYAMQEAKKLGKKIAYTYSDPFCVNRSREDFIRISKEFVDIAFCNHEEAMAMTETDNPEDAIRLMGDFAPLVFMTWGSHGAYVSNEGVEKHIPGFPVKAVDSNGAGDGFAAGVLYGLTHGFSVEKACRWGNYVASRIILEMGPRINYSLSDKIEEILG
ncbi:MAG: adenosine kinase [Leptospiraceae bacterium]|nr:adenosine kinase [Leptospiraceae bacterium]MCP5510292.1 adenosine kinase [Leptospiraceae bacterium]